MNFFQYIRGAWGNPKAYINVQSQSYARVVGTLLVWVVFLSALHTAVLYTSVRHTVKNIIPSIAAQFPSNLTLTLSQGIMTSNSSTTISLFSIDTVRASVDTSRTMMQIDTTLSAPAISIVQDGIVLSYEKNIEKILYPKQDFTVTKKNIQEWSDTTQTLVPWLIGAVFLFLSISNLFLSTLLSVFFMSVIILYSRTQKINILYRHAYKVGIYVLIPVMTMVTGLYIVFGFTSFIVASTVGFLSLYYGLRK